MVVLYSKAFGGFHLLFRLYGSAVPRTLLPTVLSTGLTALLWFEPGNNYFTQLWRHPYPFQLFAFVVGFILVFRSNLGYSRYWEGRSQLQLLSAHWSDAVMRAIVFEASSTSSSSGGSSGSSGSRQVPLSPSPAPAGPAGAASGASVSGAANRSAAPQLCPEFCRKLLHRASLAHGLCLQHLRRDWLLSNLSLHTQGCPAPPVDARGLPGYPVSWLSLLTLRSHSATRMRYHRAMPLPVLGEVSASEREGLGERLEEDGAVETETLFTGLNQQRSTVEPQSARPVRQFGCWLSQRLEVNTGTVVEGAAERAAIAYTWIQLLLAQRAHAGRGGGSWDIAAPTAAAVWAQLSQGWASFEACRKLSQTPFPFPWAQNMVLLLVLYSITVPCMMVGWLDELWAALVLNFISVLTYWTVNEVARDIEDVFFYDPNDAPLARMQWDFNRRLLAAVQAVQVDDLRPA